MNRALERRRSAALRAVARDPRAEFRAGQLLTNAADGRTAPVAIASPYLALAYDGNDDERVQRGLADALGMLLRHCDRNMHAHLQPTEPLQRVVFDMLEQLRCQSLAPNLPGMRANLEAVSDAWCRNARSGGVAESGVGVLVYTLTHMARARLRLGLTSEEVDAIIETPRARLARLVGHGLKRLSETRDHQPAFAEAALEIGALLAQMVEDSGLADEAADAARYRMLVPPDWFDVEPQADGDMAVGLLGASGVSESLQSLGDYAVFTDEYDVETHGAELYPAELRRELRAELDTLVKAQAVSAGRIADRLRRLFGAPQRDDWYFGVDEGVVDGRRLAQLASASGSAEIFRRERLALRNDTAVAVLMDNSGSMKMQRYEVMATLADTLCRALDLAGITNEILGFTTASWSGGKPAAQWRTLGKPDAPGRLAELSHIVYKDATATYRRERHSLAAMLKPQHFAESVDGESVVWAYQRLMRRPESRKVLLVVSDGAPGESATTNANRSTYLAEHLANVVQFIERHSPVEIGALTVDGDVSSVFARSLPIDLDATLTIGTYGVFDALFDRSFVSR